MSSDNLNCLVRSNHSREAEKMEAHEKGQAGIAWLRFGVGKLDHSIVRFLSPKPMVDDRNGIN